MWTAIYGKLPMDDVVQSKGIHLASMRNGCESPQRESIRHVFVSSGIAHQVWQHFEHTFPLLVTPILLQLKLNEWWLVKLRSLL